MLELIKRGHEAIGSGGCSQPTDLGINWVGRNREEREDMKVFVTGVGGQLGHDVVNDLTACGHEAVGSDIQGMYSGVADGSAVTTVPYVQLDITDDVWIGHGATIVSTCHHIGNGAVVAVGAVVTKDVPPYAIAGGVPTRILRYRFDEDVQAKLEASKWWELTPEELYKFYTEIEQPGKWAEHITEFNN